MKTCKRCEETKPATKFYKKSSNKDGLQTYCKSCDHAKKRDCNAKLALLKEPSETPNLTPDHLKTHVYTQTILRLNSLGIWSDKGAEEALRRVEDLDLVS